MISGKKAQHIVEEISGIIDMPINFMNESGVIIASTDQTRIGTLHEGAQKVLQTKEKLIVGSEGRFSGTKEGINLPLFFENRVVGVIGITGNGQSLLQYGEIIRKMSEILIKEEIIDSQTELVNQSREVFIRDWLKGRRENEKQLSSQGWMLNINVHIPRAVTVIRVQKENAESNDQNVVEFQQKHNLIYQQLRDAIRFNDQDLVVSLGLLHFVVLLTYPKDGGNKEKEFVSNKIQYLIRQLSQIDGYSIRLGVGGLNESTYNIMRSYREAQKAEYHVKGAGQTQLVFYDDLRLEILLDGVTEELRVQYLKKTFNPEVLPHPQETLETLTEFFACNQSVNKTADRLFIHKNTLQYRLNRIKELTGYDPRVFEEAVVLYLALYLVVHK